jgi:hypothetical protein
VIIGDQVYGIDGRELVHGVGESPRSFGSVIGGGQVPRRARRCSSQASMPRSRTMTRGTDGALCLALDPGWYQSRAMK